MKTEENNKKRIAFISCLILITALVFGTMTDKTHASFDYQDCACILDSASVEYEGQKYQNSEISNTFDNSITSFALSTIDATIVSGGAVSDGAFYPGQHIFYSGTGNQLKSEVHPVKVEYSFDDVSYNIYTNFKPNTGGYNVSEPPIDVTDKDDLYIRFSLSDKNSNGLAKYIHFKRDASTTKISSITAEPSQLSSEGGESTIFIKGEQLPSSLEVRAYKDGTDTEIVSKSNLDKDNRVMAVTDTDGEFTLSFPESTSDEDETYVIRAAANGTIYDNSTTVTVAASDGDESSDDEDDEASNNDNKKGTDAKTGDNKNISLPIIFGLIALLGIVVAVLIRGLRRKYFLKD